jgi:hypothetical protein
MMMDQMNSALLAIILAKHVMDLVETHVLHVISESTEIIYPPFLMEVALVQSVNKIKKRCLNLMHIIL